MWFTTRPKRTIAWATYRRTRTGRGLDTCTRTCSRPNSRATTGQTSASCETQSNGVACRREARRHINHLTSFICLWSGLPPLWWWSSVVAGCVCGRFDGLARSCRRHINSAAIDTSKLNL